MKMPDGDAAIVDRQKLTGYCLNPAHPRGKHKGGSSQRSASRLKTPTRCELRC
jgi:hypothetical protein